MARDLGASSILILTKATYQTSCWSIHRGVALELEVWGDIRYPFWNWPCWHLELFLIQRMMERNWKHWRNIILLCTSSSQNDYHHASTEWLVPFLVYDDVANSGVWRLGIPALHWTFEEILFDRYTDQTISLSHVQVCICVRIWPWALWTGQYSMCSLGQGPRRTRIEQ